MLENDVRVLWGRLLRMCQAETIKDAVSYKGKPSEIRLGKRKTYMERGPQERIYRWIFARLSSRNGNQQSIQCINK